MSEDVVLVNENNEVVGTAKKDTIHSSHTPLHRGFSLFIFNNEGQLLLQQRSHQKQTFPLAWSNSCCGHPGLKETLEDAAKRRVKDELGLTISEPEVVLPDFRYQAEQHGIKENEFCPVLIGLTNAEPKINPDEVEKTRWVRWKEFMTMVRKNEATLSSWSKEEGRELNKNARFRKLLKLK